MGQVVKSDFYNYFTERFPLICWGPLSLLFGFTATPFIFGNIDNFLNTIIFSFLFLVAIFSLRLLDDLLSLPEDKISYPTRTLSKLMTHKQFWITSVITSLFILIVLFLLEGPYIGMAYLALYLFLLFLSQRKFKEKKIPGEKFIKLLKYPALLFLLGYSYNLTTASGLLFGSILYIAFLYNEIKGSIWPFYLSAILILVLKINY